MKKFAAAATVSVTIERGAFERVMPWEERYETEIVELGEFEAEDAEEANDIAWELFEEEFDCDTDYEVDDMEVWEV